MPNLTIKDREILARWFATRATLAEVTSTQCVGIVGNQRFTETARRAYILAWQWSAPRFGGAIGARQNALHKRHGASFLNQRFLRVRAMVARITDADGHPDVAARIAPVQP